MVEGTEKCTCMREQVVADNGNMWYTVASRCAVPHVSPLGPLRRSPRETLLVTISERSRALFNTLIRFTIRDSVCTSVFVHNYCPRHVFRAIFIGTLSARRSLQHFFARAHCTNNRAFPLRLLLEFFNHASGTVDCLKCSGVFPGHSPSLPEVFSDAILTFNYLPMWNTFRGGCRRRGQTLDGAWWRRERRPAVLMAPPVHRAQAETEPNSGGALVTRILCGLCAVFRRR